MTKSFGFHSNSRGADEIKDLAIQQIFKVPDFKVRRLLEGRHLLEGSAYFDVDTQMCSIIRGWCLFEAWRLSEEIRYIHFHCVKYAKIWVFTEPQNTGKHGP